MAGIVPNIGERRLMDSLLHGFNMDDWVVRLYKVIETIDENSVLTDFTVANYDGYSEPATNFFNSVTISGKAVLIGGSPLVFTCTGPTTANTIYGYVVHDTVWGEMIYAEEFPTPVSMSVNGDTLSILLKFRGFSEF